MKEKGIKNPGMTLGRSKNISHNSEFSIQKAKEVYPDFDEANIFGIVLSLQMVSKQLVSSKNKKSMAF